MPDLEYCAGPGTLFRIRPFFQLENRIRKRWKSSTSGREKDELQVHILEPWYSVRLEYLSLDPRWTSIQVPQINSP